MEKKFRSRGIRILRSGGDTVCKEKVYYEPDDNSIYKNIYLENMEEKGLLTLFEYSVIEGQIDTYNFHVSLSDENYMELYKGMASSITDVFESIKSCFGECMRNYTIGYRLREMAIVQQSFYFYPTIWKSTHYGIKGITDAVKISDGIAKFAKLIAVRNTSSCMEINNFAKIIHKFKGISIHPYENSIGYKIYGRVHEPFLKRYLLEKYNYDMSENEQYGECVLAALRILEGQLQGVNIYFLG